MIGNDIVDLEQASIESKWRRKGYLSKLFTSDEQNIIKQSASPDTCIWLLWSMKEAAYKIHNRTTKKRFFAPKDFKCTVSLLKDSYALGTVAYKKHLYYTQTSISKSCIHTIAISNLKAHSSVKSIPVNGYLLPEFITLESNNNQFTFRKDSHYYPLVYDNKTNQEHIASKSHHGRFGAVVYCEDKNLPHAV